MFELHVIILAAITLFLVTVTVIAWVKSHIHEAKYPYRENDAEFVAMIGTVLSFIFAIILSFALFL